MAKKKKGKTTIALPKPQFTTSTLILAALATVGIAFAAMFIGAAFDYSVNSSGKPDLSYLSAAMNRVMSDPSLIMKKLSVKNSYTKTVTMYGLIAWGLFLAYKATEEPKKTHRKGVEHGSAKWGDNKEKALLNKDNTTERIVMRDKKGKPLTDEKGNIVHAVSEKALVLASDVKLTMNTWIHGLNLNVLIIGGSGSGKTRGFALPNIMEMGSSFVITDPKGEILQASGRMLEQAGYKVRVLNLIEMDHSNNYNPFHYVYDNEGNVSEDNIKKMVDCLFKNTKGDGEKQDFWAQKGQSLLEAIVFLLFEESEYNAEFEEIEVNGEIRRRIKPETRDLSHLNFFSVTEKMRRLNYPPKGSRVPDGFFMEREPDETEEEFRERQSQGFLCPLDKDFIELEKRKGETLAARLYKEVRNAPEETGQSFLSSANVKTFFFNLTNLRNLTCCDNIHLETLGDEKTALYLLLPATSTTYNFIAAMLYSQMFDVLSNRANFKYDGTLPVHVRCIMDEFYNIGEIPNFDVIIGFVRSMGISLNIILQNLSQIKARYEKTWEIITGNCSSLIFLGGNEESTFEYISKQLGKETIDVRSLNKTKGKSPSTSESNSIMGRELMTQDELKTMPREDSVILLQNHNPFYSEKFLPEDHPNYKFLSYGGNDKFNVNEIHSVTVTQFENQCRKVDTSVNLAKADIKKVDTSVNLEKAETSKVDTSINLEKTEAPKADTSINLTKPETKKVATSGNMETNGYQVDTNVNLAKTENINPKFKEQLTATFVPDSKPKKEEKLDAGEFDDLLEEWFGDAFEAQTKEEQIEAKEDNALSDDDVFRDDLISSVTIPAVEEEFTNDSRYGELTEDFENIDLETEQEVSENEKNIGLSLEEHYSEEIEETKEEISLEDEDFGIEIITTTVSQSDFDELAFI